MRLFGRRKDKELPELNDELSVRVRPFGEELRSDSSQESHSVPVPVVSLGRLLWVKGGFIILFVLIAFRLVQIQLLESDLYKQRAEKQYRETVQLPAVRGSIIDRNGNELASHTQFVSFVADPKYVLPKSAELARTFSALFGNPASYYEKKLQSTVNGRLRRYVWLERAVKLTNVASLDVKKYPGLFMIYEPKRLYPHGDLGSAVLGGTDIDNNGISGLELEYDSLLRGVDGWIVMQKDGRGEKKPTPEYPSEQPVDGHSLRLTLDIGFQSILEQELEKGIDENNADGGIGVIVNCRTGEVMAMAGFEKSDSGVRKRLARNRAISDMFEPGSVFKVVTAAAAYEYHIVSPEKRFNAENGIYRVPLRGGRVRIIRDTHEHSVLTFEDAIVNSSNIVMAKASLDIGPERLYRMARDFGFGVQTGIDQTGELRGILKKPHQWSGTTLQTMAYGYEVGVTPLQIVMAYSAAANGGMLMQPYLVSEILPPQGVATIMNEPRSIRRVISPETAALLTRALEQVVVRGTGAEARSKAVNIAGKTGTSRKYAPGGYAMGSYTASFVGFFPLEAPKYTGIVMLDNPRSKGYYGGVTSGPVFRRIVERISGTIPDAVIIPDGTKSRDQRVALHQDEPSTRSVESKAVDKSVRSGREPQASPKGRTASSKRFNGDAQRMPDVRGYSMRRALIYLTSLDYQVSVEGVGKVIEQIPEPGTKVQKGARVRVIGKMASLVSGGE